MDKKEKKMTEEAIKNSLLPMGSNSAGFLDAASLLGKNYSRLIITKHNKLKRMFLQRTGVTEETLDLCRFPLMLVD